MQDKLAVDDFTNLASKCPLKYNARMNLIFVNPKYFQRRTGKKGSASGAAAKSQRSEDTEAESATVNQSIERAVSVYMEAVSAATTAVEEALRQLNEQIEPELLTIVLAANFIVFFQVSCRLIDK